MKNLRELRLDAGYTQKRMSEFLQISQQTYSDYENGKTFPDEKNLIAIADCFNVSVDFLLGRSDDAGVVLPFNPVPLTTKEIELLSLYRDMNDSQRLRMVAFAEGLLYGSKNERNPSKK